MNRWTIRLARGLALLALGMVGCAQEREPINRVQPNALDKSFFVGKKLNDDSDNPEFYARAFVIDNSAKQGDISVGLYSGTDRIKWEITEDALIAHKSYQIAIGQDNKTTTNKADGVVVAKYKILSHFDIKRDYNPQTGEELNVVVENTTDRPWQDRQYMRVDWSTNQVLDPMWGEMFFGKVFGDMTVAPLTYNVTNPTSEDAPHFEAKDGYFDITNKYYIEPGNTTMWGFTFPTCALVGLFTSTTTDDCNAQEATVRHSFWKVKDTDYEPTENTYRKMDVIASFGGAGDSFEPGFAGGTTQCWDPQYAYTDQCFHQYLAKLNLWEKSHWDQDCTSNEDVKGRADPNNAGSELPNGTADQCEGFVDENGTPVGGSQCDTHYMTQYAAANDGAGVKGKCTIPLRARHLKPAGYWLNKETPTELLDQLDENGYPVSGDPAPDGAPPKRGAMEDVIKSWNQLMTGAIAYGREVECRRTGSGDPNNSLQNRANCHAQYFQEDGNGNDVTQMVTFGGWGVPIAKQLDQDGPAALVACHAPVRDYDYQKVCGQVTTQKCDPQSQATQCPAGLGCNPEGHCADVLRNGDQRKNVIFYWPYDSDAHYGGVAGLGQDPETGEEHGVSATVMGRSATRAAAVYRDYLQIAMNDVTPDQFTSGVPQAIFNNIQQNGYSPNSIMGREARGEKVEFRKPEASIGARVLAKKNIPVSNTMTTKPVQIERQKFIQLMKDRRDSAITPALQSNAQPMWEALASKIRGTKWEAQIVDPHWAMESTGANGTAGANGPVSDQTLELASPFRNLDPGRVALWRAQIEGELANRGICFVDDIPRIGSVNFQGLSRWYMDKFEKEGLADDILNGDPAHGLPPSKDPTTGLWGPGYRNPDLVKQRGDVMYKDMFHGMATGIAIHEVGHTLGMRHNFASSYDAPNYMPQYWQLRSNEGQAWQACNGPRDPSQPDDCMGGRWDDAQSPDEMGLANPDATGRSQGRPGVGYFGNSTVMEYEQDYMSPGNAPFDFMYVKAVYGGVLETFDIDNPQKGGVDENTQDGFVANLAAQRAEWSLENDNFIHYTGLAHDMKVFDPSYCRPATPEELEQGQWRVVHNEICTQSPRDHEAWQDFVNDSDDGIPPPSVLANYGWLFTAWHTNMNAPYADGHMHERWNYRYGETYGSGYFHTNYSDNGADVYEVTVNNGQMYDMVYPTTYFRRNNKEYQFWDIPERTADRYFERERAFHWILADGGIPLPEYELARQESFYFLARAAMAPEPGGMGLIQQPDLSAVYDVPDSGNSTVATFNMSIIDGRYVGEEYSDAKGGQWDYLSWIDHAGFGPERGFAIRALLDGRPTLYTISRPTFLDGRNVMKNYRTDDPEGVDRFVGGILSEDWQTVAPWVKDNVPGTDPEQLPYKSPQVLNLLDNSPARPAGAQVVFPNIGYKTQLQTAINALLYAAMNSDRTLLKKMRVYIEGLDFIGAVPDSQLVKFTDPNSGYTYVAIKFGDDTVAGKTIDKGIASRMIQHAQTLAANPANTDTLKMYVGFLDDVRQLSNLFDLINPAPSGGE